MSDRFKKELFSLIKKYLNGTASADEIKLVEQFYHHFSDEPDILKNFTKEELTELQSDLRLRIKSRIVQFEKPAVSIYHNRYIQAAAVLLAASLSFFWYSSHQSRQQIIVAKNVKKPDLSPHTKQAILILANCTKVVLDSVKNGVVSQQLNANVVKSNGLLAYQPSNVEQKTVSYNTVAVPRGAKYQQIMLSDGTKVWLNTASSLKFPTSFPGRQRTVELTGEAYFEVAKNKAQPFNVKTSHQTVQVLGTHFNVNAYDDESIVRTTLFEGSVKVNSGNKNIMIKPGQQSDLDGAGNLTVKDGLDPDEVIAWKNNVFQFDHADIQTIMRQIGRWYDAEVVFSGTIPDHTYHGKISRTLNASEVFKILELGGINFTIEGRKIIVK